MISRIESRSVESINVNWLDGWSGKPLVSYGRVEVGLSGGSVSIENGIYNRFWWEEHCDVVQD